MQRKNSMVMFAFSPLYLGEELQKIIVSWNKPSANEWIYFMCGLFKILVYPIHKRQDHFKILSSLKVIKYNIIGLGTAFQKLN